MYKKIQNKINIILIFSSFLFHFLFIDISSVNYEELFSYASQYPKKINREELDLYFQYQANSIFFSKLIGFINSFFGNLEPIHIGKSISSIGYFLFGYGLIVLLERYNISRTIFFFLIITNPIIWNLGFRATPDFISFAIGFFSFSLFLKNIENKNHLLDLILGFLLSISINLKIHSIFFLILSFLIVFISKNNKKYYIKFLYFSSLAILFSLLFYIYNFIEFNFIFVNENFSSELALNFSNFIVNLIGYIGYLVLATFPVSLIFLFLTKKNLYYYIFAISLVFLIGFFFVNLKGELNIGFFLIYLKDGRILSGIVITLFFLFFLSLGKLLIHFKQNKEILIYFLFLFFFIILLSLTRPANRYLIYLIPFFYLLIFFYYNHKCSHYFFKILTYLAIIFSIMLNFLILNNQIITAKNIDNTIVYINKNLSGELIDYADIFPHRPVYVKKNSKNLTNLVRGTKFYKLKLGENKRGIYTSCEKLFIIFYPKCITIEALTVE